MHAITKRFRVEIDVTTIDNKPTIKKVGDYFRIFANALQVTPYRIRSLKIKELPLPKGKRRLAGKL